MSTPPISPIHVGCSWSVRPDPLTDNQQYAVCQSCIKAYASHSRVNVCKNFSRRQDLLHKFRVEIAKTDLICVLKLLEQCSPEVSDFYSELFYICDHIKIKFIS